MKFISIIFCVLFFVCYSCNSTKDKNNSDKDSFINFQDTIINDPAIWTMEYDTILKKDTMIRLRNVNSDTLSPEKLITILNTSWSDVHLDLVKTSHDTIFVKIPNSTFLTQQMGTSGSNYYMSSAIYTLTELKEIKFVNFYFEEGDHAVPGTYERYH